MKEWNVLHRDYQRGETEEIGRVIERRRAERGNNFLDLLRKARLRFCRPNLDIGAIFLGGVIGEVKLNAPQARGLRSIPN